jgi:oligopeptide/dipeptide ABC transporter ATP-binding protein
MSAMSILALEELVKHFPTKRGVVRAVDGISLDIAAGDTLGLVGESGSGKTTTAQCVVGIYPPTSGRIVFEGVPIGMAFKQRSKELKRKIRIVFQDPGSSLNPKRTIKQILSVPLQVHGIGTRQDRLNLMNHLLEMVELPPADYLHKHPQAIGGGEKQMVAIARALATNPRFIVLDEPTSALDVSVQGKIINVLIRLREELGLTYLFITHDLSLMRNVATRVAIMYLGKLCAVARTAAFFRSPLHPYTRMLLSSIPVVTDEEEVLKPKKIVSQGEIPSPVDVPPGCSFHLRCPERLPICSEVDPEMTAHEDGRVVRCHLFNGSERAC